MKLLKYILKLPCTGFVIMISNRCLVYSKSTVTSISTGLWWGPRMTYSYVKRIYDSAWVWSLLKLHILFMKTLACCMPVCDRSLLPIISCRHHAYSKQIHYARDIKESIRLSAGNNKAQHKHDPYLHGSWFKAWLVIFTSFPSSAYHNLRYRGSGAMVTIDWPVDTHITCGSCNMGPWTWP